jgi:putative oxidoreductase
MKQLTTIGRILFGLPFGIMGLNHFFMYNYMEGMASTFIPGGGWTVIMTGILLIAASVSIISKKFIQTSCWLLALLLLIFVVTIHVPGLFNEDPQRLIFALFGVITNVALMGGALFIAGIYKEKETEK